MSFVKESDFEDALIKLLTESCGWEKQVLEYKTEKELLQNWANILFENNRSIDRLNDYPLTEGEMQQIIEQIELLRTPLKLNGFKIQTILFYLLLCISTGVMPAFAFLKASFFMRRTCIELLRFMKFTPSNGYSHSSVIQPSDR